MNIQIQTYKLMKRCSYNPDRTDPCAAQSGAGDLALERNHVFSQGIRLMKWRILTFARLLQVGLALCLAGSAAADPPPAIGLSILSEGSNLFIRWNAGTGAYQLKSNPALNFDGAPTMPATMTPEGAWQAEVSRVTPRGFYALFAAGVPAVPQDVVLSMGRSDWRLTWTPAPDAAGYLIIIHEEVSGPIGPLGADIVLDVGLAASATISGLTLGQKYSLTVVAKNPAGQSDPSLQVQGTFGPGGPVYGYAAYRYLDPDNQPFYVRAGGATVILRRVGAPYYEFPVFIQCDETGAFREPFVPANNYTVETVSQLGVPGPPVTLTVGAEGAALQPLGIPVEPTSIFGRIRFADGTKVGIDEPLWGLYHLAKVQIFSKSALLLSEVMADAQGGYAAPPPAPDDYPVTIKATYQGLEKLLTINPNPVQQGKPPIRDLEFSQVLPRATLISAWQLGKEVTEIESGVPVEFHADADNPSQLTLDHRWHVESLDGQGAKQKAEFPAFTFKAAAAASRDVTIRLNLSDLASTSFATFRTFRIFSPPAGAAGAYSGLVAAWSPATPDVLTPLTGATISIRPPEGVPTTSTSNGSGYFEANVYPTASSYGYSPPSYNYLLRVEKPGHMRFLWSFIYNLPNEQIFPLVTTVTSSHNFTGSALAVDHADGVSVGILSGGLQSSPGVPYTGPITVSTATFNPLVRQPLPPGLVIDSGLYAGQLLDATHAAWLDIRTGAGAPLILTGVNLVVPTPGIMFFASNFDAYRQSETTSLFHPADTGSSSAGSRGILLPVTQSGLYLLGAHKGVGGLSFEADRSLNYPFDVMVGTSMFPITVKSPLSTNWGYSPYFPLATPLDVRVLDQRQSPGLHPTDLAAGAPTTWMAPWKKRVVIQRSVMASTDSFHHSLHLSLGSSIPALLRPGHTTVTDLEAEDHFLSYTANTSTVPPDPARSPRAQRQLAEDHAANDYYAEIQAPRTFQYWKELNGFPELLGAPLPGVAAEDYATAYYYNLADLGLARAQSMRVRMASDGEPDVAFYVTNYATLEDARRGVGSIATVCMDYSLRADLTGGLHRHTRFYVYKENTIDTGGIVNVRVNSADLDRAGPKAVPGLCITCHGGSRFRDGDSGNLGSRFLPFDLEGYTFHPKWGLQKTELARMNTAVLKTMPGEVGTAAITKVILGWYGGLPTISPENFNAAYMPPDWTTPSLYTAFKTGCRVCHISRDDSPSRQFGTEADFGYYQGALCTGLYMPHTQRVWSALWGTKAARNLGDLTVPDFPAALHMHEGGMGACPALSR